MVLRNVVAVHGRERIWIICVTREIVFPPLQPGTDAPLHESIQSSQDIDHDAFTTGRIRGRLFVEMSLMTTATAKRKIVPDVIEKRCHIALIFVTKLTSTAESSDNCKTCVLPDENFITVGVERFRVA